MMGVRCEGTEDKLWKCYHEEIRNVVCPKGELVAGVTCTDGEARELNVISLYTYPARHKLSGRESKMDAECVERSEFPLYIEIQARKVVFVTIR